MEIIVCSKNQGDLSAISALPSTVTKFVAPDRVAAYIAAQTNLGYNCHRFSYQYSSRAQKTVQDFSLVA